MNWDRKFELDTHYFPTHIRIDSLFFGVLLGYYYHFKPEVLDWFYRRRALCFVAGVSLILPMLFHTMGDRFVWTIGYTTNYLGYGLILLAVLSATPGVGLGGRVLASPVGKVIGFIGVYSYSIYLWHVDIGQNILFHHTAQLFRQLPGEVRIFAYLACYIAIATFVGLASYYLIERPGLKVRDWIFPGRANAVGAHPAVPVELLLSNPASPAIFVSAASAEPTPV